MVGAVAEGAGDQTQALGGDGQGESDAPVGLFGPHGAGRQDDHLIGVGHDRGVGFGAAHDDPVGPTLDDAQVHVGLGLRAGSLDAVALHVGLGDGQGEVVVAAVLPEGQRALVVLGVFELGGDGEQREERVGADLLDQHDQRVALGGGGLDQLGALAQVVGLAGDLEVAAV